MSKSLARVRAALTEAGMDAAIVEMPDGTRTAEEAARAVGCEIDRIAKSLVFRAGEEAVLLLTAGGDRAFPERAGAHLGLALERADAGFVRERTGFAIGGVAPIAHRARPRAVWDPRLDAFATVWAAAGTPRHVFEIAPARLREMTGAVVVPDAFDRM
jgi:prolyl-tRNA editing enzyme YbaK/EbsC (Cys-tRNA(Pro) deacylase)